MKVKILDAHDRLKHFVKDQSQNIFKGAEDCLKKNEDSIFYQSRSPYIYIFAHPRTADDGVNKRMVWQPRLLKPEAQTNSYLFRAISHTDIIEICWLLPPKELWNQYIKDNLLEDQDVLWSIDQFKNNKAKLQADHPDDLSEERGREIMKELIFNKRTDRLMKRVYYDI